MTNKQILLAFSGGLDTSYCAVYLKQEKGYDVHAVTVDTGGLTDDDRQRLEQHASQLGTTSFRIIDAKKNYYAQIIRFLISGNVLKNGAYPLSVSAERIIQALALSAEARRLGVEAIAHGSTGAGNDQVRFDMAFNILIPEIKIVTPIRDQSLSRQAEIEYLSNAGVFMDFKKAVYSVNKGLWGTSVGGKETLTSHLPLPEHAWPYQLTKNGTENFRIGFEAGEPCSLNGEKMEPVALIEYLSAIVQPYCVGRDIHIGDTVIGIKGRVGFEAGAPMIIIKAHHALEKHVLTKWQLYWKDQLALWYGNWLHEGQYLDPVMRDIENFFTSTQKSVTGEVSITVSPYRFQIDGIVSKHDLMNADFAAYGESNASFTGNDVKGFTKIFGNQTSIYQKVNHAIVEKTEDIV
jgi:argininosuccinate synthase